MEWVVIPSLGDLVNPGIEPRSPTLQVDSLPAEPQGKPKNTGSQECWATREATRVAYTFSREYSWSRNWTGISCIAGGFFTSWAMREVSQFSRSVMSESLWPHEPQHARPPCPSPTPGVYPNSCPLSRWCHLTISPSVIPFSSCPQSFSASGSFPMSQLFASVGQNIGVSASPSVFLMNTQDWFSLGWTGWIFLQSKGLSRVFSNTTVQKHQFFSVQFLIVHLSHPYMTTGKTIALTRWTFVGKVMSLLFKMLHAMIMTFLLRSVF